MDVCRRAIELTETAAAKAKRIVEGRISNELVGVCMNALFSV